MEEWVELDDKSIKKEKKNDVEIKTEILLPLIYIFKSLQECGMLWDLLIEGWKCKKE